MRALIMKTLFIVAVLSFVALAGCQSSSMNSNKGVSQPKIEGWQETPSGVDIPTYR
jgi:outer membrane lipoprotein SlyB